jgi:NADH:ubiquinone oxidoreductase subunit 4 (subunit M)
VVLAPLPYRSGVSGAVLQMVNHGLSTGALFLIVGMLYERRHTREMSQFGGLLKVVRSFGFDDDRNALSMGMPPQWFCRRVPILLGSFGSEALGSPGNPGGDGRRDSGGSLSAGDVRKVFLGR